MVKCSASHVKDYPVRLSDGSAQFSDFDVAGLKNKNGVIYDVKAYLDPAVVDGRL